MVTLEPAAALNARARTGDAAARCALGERLLIGREAPLKPREGAALIAMAAKQGHGPALLRQAVLSVSGLAAAPNWPQAFKLLTAAAEAGDARAQTQAALLGRFNRKLLDAPPTEMCFAAPRISVARGLLTREHCDWLIERAAPLRRSAMVSDQRTGALEAHQGRTNSAAALDLVEADMIVQLANARIAAVLGLPIAQQENAQVLHYAAGQQFERHFDFLDPREPGYTSELQRYGQRVATVLIYLNDAYEGGETEFPELSWRFKGGVGDALVFWNVTPDGAPDPQTLHAGTAPTQGEKWLFSKWVRAKPFTLG